MCAVLIQLVYIKGHRHRPWELTRLSHQFLAGYPSARWHYHCPSSKPTRTLPTVSQPIKTLPALGQFVNMPILANQEPSRPLSTYVSHLLHGSHIEKSCEATQGPVWQCTSSSFCNINTSLFYVFSVHHKQNKNTNSRVSIIMYYTVTYYKRH